MVPNIDRSWIGVDLDGTLAFYEEGQDYMHIGEPIPLMVQRVKFWLSQGKTVKIVTARVAHWDITVVDLIRKWCIEHIGATLPITNEKDYSMVELWDDRCVQVILNTGKRADGKEEALIP